MTAKQNIHKSIYENIHGTGLIYNGCGVLIRGNSGAGKSLLALALLDAATSFNLEAYLVGDDRLNLFTKAEEVFMSGPENLRGKIELFGYGIIDRAFVENAKVNLVVDIVSGVVRMPEEKEMTTSLWGIKLPRCAVAKNSNIGLTHQRMIVVEAITKLQADIWENEK